MSTKKEAQHLLEKSLDSLTLAIELFNRPQEQGRSSAVVILLDHSFEMFLKAALLHRGGTIRETNAHNTISLKVSVGRALSDGAVKFLDEDQAMTIRMINGVRDACQHHLADLCEEQLYLHIQSGVTLLRDLIQTVFQKDLTNYLPRRVLPISTIAPTSIEMIFDSQMAEVKKLLAPGRRKKAEAMEILRPIAVLERSLQDREGQPSNRELEKLANGLKKSDDWRNVFRDVATLTVDSQAVGHRVDLRFSKNGGAPVQIVKAGEDTNIIVGKQVVNILDFYNLTPTKFKDRLGVSMNRFTAYSRYLKLEENNEHFYLLKVGKQEHKRFSQKALSFARDQLGKMSDQEKDEIYERHRPKRNNNNTAKP
jgi:hypothetical protein